jgi:hypothetical protein
VRVRFAPAIEPSLARLVAELDDDTRAIAAIWRELGHRARAAGLYQPSYESIRRIVHAHRALRRLLYAKIVHSVGTAVELAWRVQQRSGTTPREPALAPAAYRRHASWWPPPSSRAAA